MAIDPHNVIIVPLAGRAEGWEPHPPDPPDPDPPNTVSVPVAQLVLSPYAPDTGIASPGAGPLIANYPFVTCGFAIGNGTPRRTIEPSKTNFASKNFAVHQVIWFSAEHYRRIRHTEFQQMWDINPLQVHIPHIDFHGIGFEPQNSGSATWFSEYLVYDDSANFHDWIATSLMSRAEYPGSPFTSMQSFHDHLSFRWDGPEAIHTAIATRMWEDWSNFNDSRTYAEGGANLARDFKFGIMQDTLAQDASNGIQWFPELETTITGVVNDNELQIGTWSIANGTGVSDAANHFSGSADSAGYTLNSHELQIIVFKSNHTNAYSDTIDGHKVINGSTDQIRITGTGRFTPSVGDEIWVKVKQFEVQPSDRRSNPWDRDLYHIRTVFNLETVSQLNLANYGIKTGIYSNQVSQNANRKRTASQADAEKMPVTLWLGKWDGMHWEHGDDQMGFTGDWEEIGYWVKNSLHQRNSQDYDPDDFPIIAAANLPLLKSNAASANGYPCIWFNIEHVRKLNWDNIGPGVEERYAFLTELDAAFVRFWSCVCWCCENMAPQPSMGAHADPVMIDEELIEAGNPIIPRNFWENYDQTGNFGKGTYDWKTPDFGTYGYFFEFDNCMIQVNLRVPTNINIAWIPSHMTGGQAIDPELDRGILPYAGDGFKWQAFNRATYVNDDPSTWFYGKTPSDYDATYIMSDAELNNGADRDTFFDVGACEAVIHMRVPTTNNPVTVDTTNSRLFYYKEKPIQLYGHQNVRHNVAYATKHDIPAIQDVAGKIQLYFDLLATRGMNNIRLWPYFTSDTTNPIGPAAPLPWARPGPGTAEDGEPRFDLTIHNQAYFDRIDEICEEAYRRDVIVTILFWDVYGFHGGGGRGAANPFTNRSTQNNINSIETDINNNSMGLDGMYEGTVPANIKAIQIAYEEKLIDTVNQYPNIIYEVNNEQGRLPFQTDVMARVRAYEATLPNQHLVSLSAGGLLDNTFYTKTDVGKTAVKGTSCDVIMPGTDEFSGTWGDTKDRWPSADGPPLQDDTTRPWVMDMDHIEPHARRPDHLWKCVCRGYGYVSFESNDINDPSGVSEPLATLGWEAFMTDVTYGFNIIRRNIGTAQKWLNNQTKDLAAMVPTDDTSVSSSTYCLADPGEDYITFSPSNPTITVKQLISGQTYRYKWWDATLGVEEPGTGTFVASGTTEALAAPFTLGSDGAAIHLWRIS